MDDDFNQGKMDASKAFESEGFIWGGYWAIWDNMHFEYHPELIAKMKTKENID